MFGMEVLAVLFICVVYFVYALYPKVKKLGKSGLKMCFRSISCFDTHTFPVQCLFDRSMMC